MPTSHRIGYTAVTGNGEIPMQALVQVEELCRNSAQANLQPSGYTALSVLQRSKHGSAKSYDIRT
jgi:hypothetical protein